MALLRAPMLRSVNQLAVLRPFGQHTLSRAIAASSSKNPDRQRIGFLEQMQVSLVPEVIPTAVAASKKDSRRTSYSRGSMGSDERDHNAKRTLVRESTAMLRELVISRYASEPLPRAVPEIPQLIVLDGYKGVGKSSVLEQTVAFARLNGFIVLYIPDPQAWTHGSGFFAASSVEDKDPAMEGLGAVRFYDRPTQTRNVFKVMLEMHRDDLADIKCRKDFSTELTAQCMTLLDLIELGDQVLDDIDSNWRKNPALAGEVLDRLIKELCVCESKPVAIIIDNFERFVGLTCMVNERQERLHANSIRAVAEHFGRDAVERTASRLANGFVLLATDPLYAFEGWRKSRVRSGVEYPLSEDILEDPSGRNWMKDFKQRVRDRSSKRQLLVHVPELSTSELKTLCSTFVSGGLRRLVDDANPAPEHERLVALAGGRADLMRKIALSR